MQTATIHGAGQLTAILLSAVILIAQPHWAQMVVLLISFSMAFSMGCAMSVGYYYSSRGIETLSRSHASLLGTQFGGILCYLIMICQAFEHIH
ncbi:hypothetical protein [Kaarinaea lacus]